MQPVRKRLTLHFFKHANTPPQMFALNADLMGAFHQEVEQQMAAMTSKMDVSD